MRKYFTLPLKNTRELMKIAEITITLLVLFTFTDTPSAGWRRTYSRGGEDAGYCVIQTEDGGYAVVGYCGDSVYTTERYVYLLRTDPDGNLLWSRVLGDWLCQGTAYSVVETEDRGFLIVGHGGPYDPLHPLRGTAYVIRTDSLGDTLWTRTYGDEGLPYGSETLYSVAKTGDGGFIAGGGASGGAYLIRLNSSGDTLWTRTYGEGRCNSLVVASNGDFVFCGSVSHSSQDIYVARTDSTGDLLWSRSYGTEDINEGGCDILELENGDFVVLGMIDSFPMVPAPTDIYLLCIEGSSGDTVWSKTYGGWSSYYGYSIVGTDDGGFAISGSAPGIFSYLLRTDSTGDTLWSRDLGVRGGGVMGNWMEKCSDKGFIITGGVFDSPTDISVYLIKTDSLGYVDTTAIEEDISHKPREVAISAYPNPFNSSCCITVPGGAKLEIYDLRGRLVYKMPTSLPPATPYEIIWQPDKPLASGVYLIRAMTRNGRMMTKKLVLLK